MAPACRPLPEPLLESPVHTSHFMDALMSGCVALVAVLAIRAVRVTGGIIDVKVSVVIVEEVAGWGGPLRGIPTLTSRVVAAIRRGTPMDDIVSCLGAEVAGWGEPLRRVVVAGRVMTSLG